MLSNGSNMFSGFRIIDCIGTFFPIDTDQIHIMLSFRQICYNERRYVIFQKSVGNEITFFHGAGETLSRLIAMNEYPSWNFWIIIRWSDGVFVIYN